MKKIVMYFSIILISCGVFGFIITMLLGNYIRTKNIELPLITIQGVVQKADTLYFGNGTYRRIQKYDLHGNYIGFENLENVSQNFYFSIDETGKCNAENNMINSVVPSKYLCEGSISYTIEKRIPLKITCLAKPEIVQIQQSIMTYVWFPVFWLIVCGIGMFLYLFTNSKKILEKLQSKD